MSTRHRDDCNTPTDFIRKGSNPMSWELNVVQKERSRAAVITVTVAAPTGTQ